MKIIFNLKRNRQKKVDELLSNDKSTEEKNFLHDSTNEKSFDLHTNDDSEIAQEIN